MQKFIRSPQTHFENIDDETVILSLHDGCYYGLNATGRMLWDALVTPKTKAELTAHLAAEFPEVANTAVQTDVEEFITAVLEPGLIELETH